MSFISLLLLISTIRLSSAKLYDQRLTSKKHILDFFYHSSQEAQYGWITVFYKESNKSFVIDSRNEFHSLDTVNQRVDRDKYQSYNKGLFIEFDPQSFNDYHAYVPRDVYRKKKNIIALPVANGPNSDHALVNITQIFPPNNNRTQDHNRPNIALLFREFAPKVTSDDTAYTIEQFEEMSRFWAQYPEAYIVFDASFFSEMETPPEIERFFPYGRAIIYQAPNQPLPTHMKLKKNFVSLYVHMEVMILIPGDFQLRAESFIPNVAWSMWPVNLDSNTFSNFRFFLSHIRMASQDRRLMLIEVAVRKCKLEKSGRIIYTVYPTCTSQPLELRHLLQSLDYESIVLCKLIDSEGVGPLNPIGSVLRPFVLVEMVNGPNCHGEPVQTSEGLLGRDRLYFVVSLCEMRGTEVSYTKEHIEELVKMMESISLKETKLGVRLRMDFLAAVKLEEQQSVLGPLKAHYRFSWLFVHDGRSFSRDQVGSLTWPEIIVLKQHIRWLAKETYLTVPVHVRSMLSIDPEIHPTDPPRTTRALYTEKTTRGIRVRGRGMSFPTVKLKAPLIARLGRYTWMSVVLGILLGVLNS